MVSERIRIGMLTPSSNTILEPITQAMLNGLPHVTAHFSRFPVTETSLSKHAAAQYDDSPMLRAAELLADARCDVIGWNGTSSAWLGFDNDARLCGRITDATGIPVTTSIQAMNQILGQAGVKTIGLVTPYLQDVQNRIMQNYSGFGIFCQSERHLGIRDNFTFATIPDNTIRTMVRQVATPRPDAILTICTNMGAAAFVASLEAELGVPIYDSVTTVLWKCLLMTGVDPARITGWGSVFSQRDGMAAPLRKAAS